MPKLYSDKSKMTMKLDMLKLYQQHTKMMNLIESTQNMMCRHGHNMVEFLPV